MSRLLYMSWMTCSVCNKDKRIDQFGERTVPPVCDECQAERPKLPDPKPSHMRIVGRNPANPWWKP